MEQKMSRAEAKMEDGHGYGVADATKELAAIHQVFNDTLIAFTDCCISNRIHLSALDFVLAMEGVGEALADVAEEPLRLLPNESYTPLDAKNLVDASHGRLIASFRLTALDVNAAAMNEVKALFRPQPTRGSAPTNPSTIQAKGDL